MTTTLLQTFKKYFLSFFLITNIFLIFEMKQCLNDFWLTKDSLFEVCLEDMQSDII